jgi:hypothetical protein
MEVRMALSKSSLKMVLVLVLFASSFVLAQSDFNWAKGFGLLGTDIGRAITTDVSGNIYLTGEFAASGSLGGTLTLPGGVTMTSQGNADYFLAKFDKSGNAIWARTAGSGLGSFTERGYGVTVDHSGNEITAGHINRTTTFAGGSYPPITITAAGVNLDGFVAKYTPAGDLSWVKTVTGVSQISARKVAADQSNNIVCVGYYGTSSGNDTANFFGVVPTLHSVASSRDWYIVKYDSNGTALWARSAGGTGSDEPADVVVDAAGNIYTCGSASGTLIGFGSINLVCDTVDAWKYGLKNDAIVAKYSPSGDIIWAKNFGGRKEDQAYGMTLDGLGNLYVCGNFDSAATFGSLSVVNSNGTMDAFLLKMDTAGTPIWVRHGGGSGGTWNSPLNEYAYEVVLDKSGNPWMTGTFQGTGVFDALSVTTAGVEDIYVAQYSPSGTILQLKRAGGTGTDKPWYLCLEPNGNLLLSGQYAATPTFGTTTLTNVGGNDCFFAEFGGRVLNQTALIDWFYDGSTMVPDIVKVELHNSISPYTMMDSISQVLSTAGVADFNFVNAVNGTPYYAVIKHRNAVETWSASTITFTSGAASYDFTSAQTQAYGSNLALHGSKWCLYNGDVNHDGAVDGTDLGAVDNDNNAFVTGYTDTDLNGDGAVDGSDLGIVDNNNNAFIAAVLPPGAPNAIHVKKPAQINTQHSDNK